MRRVRSTLVGLVVLACATPIAAQWIDYKLSTTPRLPDGRPDMTAPAPRAADGRPEVFAFGVRNPFRVTCDLKTGLIIWGEVGCNVRTELDLGPEGFDELNATREPGFFGWPFCVGPNLPWRQFDPKTQKPVGDYYDPAKVINDSQANTGLKELPPARPAAFYYNNLPSKEWPFVGSGGRSITTSFRFPYTQYTASQCVMPRWYRFHVINYLSWPQCVRIDDSAAML